MKKRVFALIVLISAAALLMSCGGGGGGGSSNAGTSLVTISIGGGQQASMMVQKNTLLARAKMLFRGLITPHEASAAGIPSGIRRFSFIISAPDMTTITRDVVSWSDDINETFTVPNGENRHFEVLAYGDDEVLLYYGETYDDIGGGDSTVTLNMVSACDLYVDVNTGSDAPGCRDRNEPCKSITYALSQTNGNETICVSEGHYHDGEEMGGYEFFPLQLKPGTRLLCQGGNHSTVIDNDLGWGPAIIGAGRASVEGCMIIKGVPAIKDEHGPMTIKNNLIEDTCIGITVINTSTITGNTIQNMWESECENAAIEVRSKATISNNTIKNNEVDGIVVNSGNPSITGNTITDNYRGITVIHGNPVINDNTLSCNNQGHYRANLINYTAQTIDARNNRWDYEPPAVEEDCEDYYCYWDDICNAGRGSVDYSGYSLAPSPCRE